MKEYKEFVLDNGLRVGLVKTENKTVAMGAMVNFGASYEKEGEEGLVHVIEHNLIFGGSEKLSPCQVLEKVNFFGFFDFGINAGRTTMEIGAMRNDLESALEFMSQTLFYPRFDRERLDIEKGSILREMDERKMSNSYKYDIPMWKALFGDHPVNYNSIGNPEVIRNVSREKLMEIYQRGFGARNSELIVAGDIPENCEKLVRDYFQGVRAGENMRKKFPRAEKNEQKILVWNCPRLLNEKEPSESLCNINMGFQAPTDDDKDYFAMSVANDILGGKVNSRLFQALRVENGLSYSPHSSYSTRFNTGSIFVDCTVQSKKQEETTDILFRVLKKMKEEMPSEEEVYRSKRTVEFKIASAMDSAYGRAIEVRKLWDYGVNTDELLGMYESVKREDVQRVCREYFPERKDGKYVLMILDPLKKEEK